MNTTISLTADIRERRNGNKYVEQFDFKNQNGSNKSPFIYSKEVQNFKMNPIKKELNDYSPRVKNAGIKLYPILRSLSL